MEQMINKAPETWEVMWEVFSVPFGEAAKLKRNQKSSAKIYEDLVKRSETEKGVLEEFVILTGKIGKKSEGDSVEELIYPTEFEPPEIPLKVAKIPNDPKVAGFLSTPAMPTAFDTGKLGTSLEIGFEEKKTPEVIMIKVDFERIEFLGLSIWGQGKATTQMPEFAVQGYKKEVLLKSGEPVMVGTMSPPKNRPEKNKKRRVWFAFATASPSGE